MKTNLSVGMSTLILILANASYGQEAVQAEDAVPDRAISARIEALVASDEGVPAQELAVATQNGIVTLAGRVPHLYAKRRATQLAGTVKGVRSIVDRIEVSPRVREDAAIEEDVRQAILHDPAVRPHDIEVDVENGIVTFRGEASSHQQKELCGDVALQVRGVRDIKNEISVEVSAEREDETILADVRRALRFDPWLDLNRIDVEVNDDHVTLAGVVGSLYQKRRAMDRARVAGVKSVEADGLVTDSAATHPRDTVRGHPPIADPEIATAIRDAFRQDPRLEDAELDVEVTNGAVVLSGRVEGLAARRSAVQDARNTRGVKWVVNHVRVRPEKMWTDEVLAATVREALERDPVLDAKRLEISARNGRVRLAGDVESTHMRERAEDLASRVSGVVAVTNVVNAGSAPVPPGQRFARRRWPLADQATIDARIQASIESELWWALTVDKDAVTVSVQDGAATLTGDVGSYQAMAEALRAAYRGGARKVRNRLHVQGEEKSGTPF